MVDPTFNPATQEAWKVDQEDCLNLDSILECAAECGLNK